MLIPSVSVLIMGAVILTVLIASDWYLWRSKVIRLPTVTPTNAAPDLACQDDRKAA